MLPLQQGSSRRVKGKSSKGSANWRLFSLLLILTSISLLTWKYYSANRRNEESEDIQEILQASEQLAATFHEATEAQTLSLTKLEQHFQDLQQQVLAFNTCMQPESTVWRHVPLELRQHNVNEHKAAILVPYRDRETQLSTFLPEMAAFLAAQGRDFDIFVIEQTSRFHFNRGALLNAGVLLLQASEYDYFVFHDVDTIPTEAGNIQYEFPYGRNPLHLTPAGIHPKGIRYEDFFGGIVAFSAEQITAVNGFGTNFWGWGREDDNMRERLLRQGRWPPQKPEVNMHRGRRYYFKHAVHSKAPEVRMQKSEGNVTKYVSVHPDKPYGKSLIVSSQPENFLDFSTGLNTTAFRIISVQPVSNLAVRYTVDLFCDRVKTPWCE